MFLVGIISWWYGKGWWQRVDSVKERVASTFDYFSIGLLFGTLFSPFKQISAGGVSGPPGVKMNAFFDRLISRSIGFVMRSFMIVVGTAYIALQFVVGALTLAFWLVIPLFPFAGLIMMTIGWTPTWL